jgi:hypothetical protein
MRVFGVHVNLSVAKLVRCGMTDLQSAVETPKKKRPEAHPLKGGSGL